GPATRFGSGGAEFTPKVPAGPVKPLPTPSKPTPSAGAEAVPGAACTTGSGPPGAGAGTPRSGFSARSMFGPVAAGMSFSGFETSWWTFAGNSSAIAAGGPFACARVEPAEPACSVDPGAPLPERGGRERDDGAFDEERRDAERLAPVADVVARLREPDRSAEHVADDHARREAGGGAPGPTGARAHEETGE